MSRPVLTTDDGVIDVCFSFHFRTADIDFSNHMVLTLNDLHVCQLQNEVEYIEYHHKASFDDYTNQTFIVRICFG